MTSSICRVADLPAAQQLLIEQQREFARLGNLVAEGRDQGTDVFPDADVKYYLDASLDERAARRLRDLSAQGVCATQEEVRRQIADRDQLDRSRPVGSLRLAPDMIVIDSTDMTADQVVAKMLESVELRRKARMGKAQCSVEERS